MGHALLKACVDKLDQAGHSYNLPSGSTVFVNAENYSNATNAAIDLKPCHIPVTHPFLKELKKQVKTAQRVNIRSVRLIANCFGHDER